MTHSELLCWVRWGFAPPFVAPLIRLVLNSFWDLGSRRGSAALGCKNGAKKAEFWCRALSPVLHILGVPIGMGPMYLAPPHSQRGAMEVPSTTHSCVSSPGFHAPVPLPLREMGERGVCVGGVVCRPGEGRREKGQPWNLSWKELGSTRGAVCRVDACMGLCAGWKPWT